MVVFVLRNIPIPEVHQSATLPEYYDELPNKYDPQTWPQYTGLQCYNCTLITKRKPIFIPTGRSATGQLLRNNGPIYCSTCCMFKSLQDMNLNPSTFKNYLDLAKELIYTMVGENADVIVPSDSRSSLKRFGGSKTDGEYQSEILNFCPFIRKFYANDSDYMNDCR